VFEQVIRDVCDASLVDFEEGGVGGGALEDLKLVGDHLREMRHTQAEDISVGS
jgi:hypothetical protein